MATSFEHVDAVVAVKRIPDRLLETIRKSRKPWAWDVVDAYPQPECSTWNRERCIDWLHSEVRRLSPDLVILPNACMQKDLGFGEVIYHHHRPGIERNRIRERIECLGYEGSEKYVAGWLKAIDAECRARGMRFVVNPPRLADVDVVLALRGAGFDGYAQRSWKSNVKLANAHGSATPFIGSPECGYIETASGFEGWAGSPTDLAVALDWLESVETRREVGERFLASAFTVEDAARRYREVLRGLS